MDFGQERWLTLAALVLGALLVIGVMWMLWNRVAERREAQRRIEAARVRSGHVPLEIPTVRGSLNRSQETAPDTLPEWFIQGKGGSAMVDEQPRIRVRYIDEEGRKAETIMQVDHLDVQKKFITGHSELPGAVQRLPLHRITSARIADTGQRFNLDTWVDAVRVARRRRGA